MIKIFTIICQFRVVNDVVFIVQLLLLFSVFSYCCCFHSSVICCCSPISVIGAVFIVQLFAAVFIVQLFATFHIAQLLVLFSLFSHWCCSHSYW